MAEAACVLHAFTFPTSKQGLEMDALHDSVSFGRFATETLAWDKWSSFSNKRYVEEAAKHSQPGLVAKKKAFFEAYYKKKALLEQEDANDGNYTQDLENVTYLSSETVVSEAPHMVSEQDDVAEPLEADLELKSKPVEVAKMVVITYTKENEPISKDVNTRPEPEVPEVSAGSMLRVCPQLPPVLRASSKRAYSAKGHRVSFHESIEDITKNTDGVSASKGPMNLESTAVELTEAKSRRNKTDPHRFSESSKACIESNSPIISSPFGFGTGKGTEKNREKFEEILNSKGSKRVKLQTKLKERAAKQLKKLRLGFCFSSKPSPHLQNQSQAQENQAKLEKHRTSMANGCWKHVEKHRSHRQIRPGSLGEVIAQKGKLSIAQIL